jgi:small conductance mechanosensitive channel
MEDISVYVAKLQEVAVEFGLNLLATIAIFIIGRWAASLTSKFVKRLLARKEVDVLVVNFVSTILYYALLAFVVVAALNRLGIQTASFIAVVGAAGLAIGLALQGSLSNFAAGVLMVFFRPFSVGDFIEGGGTMGVVEEITLFTTTLLTPDNKVIIVPNAKLNNENITNFNVRGERRIDLVVGVGYDADTKRVKQIILDEIYKDKRFLKEPAPMVGLLELADSSVNFAVRPWVKASDYWPVFFEFQENVKCRLDEEGISIPFPQRDIHIFQNN